MRAFINYYFSFILLLAGLTGLLLPDPGNAASFIILSLLFIIIFVSCFQLDLKKEYFFKESRNAIIFTVFRFVLIPLGFYFVIYPVSEFYAFALLFVLILPSAVAAPPVIAMFTKNINLSLMILALSSLVATFTIPILVTWLSGGVASVNPLDLFRTVFITVVLPFFVHLPLRKKTKVKKWMISNLTFVTIICISLIMMLAISKNKQTVFDQPDMILMFGIISFFFYLVLFVMGWFMMPGKQINNKVTFTVSSGLNNIGLGISLATIYLPPMIAVFCIMAQFAWIVTLMPVRLFLSRIKGRG